jgi:uncharacterized protein YbaR (Trm112 family)
MIRDFCRLRIPPPLRLCNLMLQNCHEQLIRILASPHRHHPRRVDLVEHGDVRVHLVGRRERRRFQVHDRSPVRLGLGAL